MSGGGPTTAWYDEVGPKQSSPGRGRDRDKLLEPLPPIFGDSVDGTDDEEVRAPHRTAGSCVLGDHRRGEQEERRMAQALNGAHSKSMGALPQINEPALDALKRQVDDLKSQLRKQKRENLGATDRLAEAEAERRRLSEELEVGLAPLREVQAQLAIEERAHQRTKDNANEVAKAAQADMDRTIEVAPRTPRATPFPSTASFIGTGAQT
jgi:hypothetical protein